MKNYEAGVDTNPEDDEDDGAAVGFVLIGTFWTAVIIVGSTLIMAWVAAK